ncbi:MAG: DUF2207 domain-containing protein, partial [Clostridia bacterium]|nr:DUF2207 domain-containing protein [Clostridia bacterium]
MTNLTKKRIWALIVGVIILIIPFFFGSCANENYRGAVNSRYTINSLNLDCNVKENGSVDIVYDISITMKEDERMRELLITIPYYGKLYSSENGTLVAREYSAKVSNFKLIDSSQEVYLNEYNDSNDQDCPTNNVMVGLKKASNYYEGGESYSFKFSYNYKMNNQKVNNLDELYLNLLGTNSSMKINNVSFNIAFYKDIDFTTFKPAIYYGEVGGTKEYTDFLTTSNSISSNAPINLNAYESLTLRQFAPEGYFNYEQVSKAPLVIAIVITIVGVIGILLVRFFSSQRHEVPSPVELMAPQDIMPNEAEYVVKYKTSNKQFGASIVWLASHGYIKIEDKDGKTTLIKLKDADDSLDVNLKKLMESIFSSSDYATLDSLSTISISGAVRKLKKSPELKYEDEMFSKRSRSAYTFTDLLMLACIVLNVIMLYLQVKNYVGFANASAIPLRWFVGGKIILILNLILITFWFVVLKPKFNTETEIGNEFILKRGRMLGLKNYIKKVEEPQLRMFAKENPSLFYDILPYAYVLGVSSIWIDKFKFIELENPDWYSGDTLFTIYWANRFAYRSISVIDRANAKAFSSNISSSSFGGSSGGGGFSGGG